MIKEALLKYKNLPVQMKASFWFLICAFLQKGISAISTPIFTRIMTPAEYGQYGVFNSWYGIVTIIVGLSLTYGVHMQGLIKFSDEKEAFTSSLQGLLTSLVLVWTGIYMLFSDFWNSILSLTSVQMYSMLVMVWTTSIFNFWANEQRVLYKYRFLVTITLLVSIVKPLVGIYMVVTSADKVTARILAVTLVELIGYSWLFFARLKIKPIFFSKKFWKYALCFNLPLVPHYLSQVVLNSSDRIMIKNMIGATETGIYDLAYSVSLIMTLFNVALLQAITPWMYQKIKEKKNKDLARIAYITLIFIAGVNILIMCFAPEVVAVFAPPAYYDAIWIVPPVAMSVFFMFSYDLFAKFAFYYEKTRFIMLASIIAALSNVILNYIFIDRFGYIAAGYTTLACFIIYALGHYIFMQKVCDECCNSNYPYDAKRILGITAVFLLCGFMVLATYNLPILRYAIILIIGTVLMCHRMSIISWIKLIMQMKRK